MGPSSGAFTIRCWRLCGSTDVCGHDDEDIDGRDMLGSRERGVEIESSNNKRCMKTSQMRGEGRGAFEL